MDLGPNTPPLFSVVVITYNSAIYVVETLESIKEQTYKNIELIIADDGSSDKTIEICNNWLEENKSSFSRAFIITSEKNRGIPANCNKGLYAATGKWIKFIAGDDKLISNALSDVIDFVTLYDDVEALDSVVDIYNGDFNTKISQYDFSTLEFHKNNVTALEQRKMFSNALFGHRIISTLGVFLKRELIVDLGGFDEKYKLLEDSPLWWKILKANKKFHFMNKTTTCYRRHEKSISFNKKVDYFERIVSDFQLTVLSFTKDHLIYETTLLNKVNLIWMIFLSKLVLFLGNRGRFVNLIYKIGLYLQPLRLNSLIKEVKA